MLQNTFYYLIFGLLRIIALFYIGFFVHIVTKQ